MVYSNCFISFRNIDTLIAVMLLLICKVEIDIRQRNADGQNSSTHFDVVYTAA